MFQQYLLILCFAVSLAFSLLGISSEISRIRDTEEEPMAQMLLKLSLDKCCVPRRARYYAQTLFYLLKMKSKLHSQREWSVP